IAEEGPFQPATGGPLEIGPNPYLDRETFKGRSFRLVRQEEELSLGKEKTTEVEQTELNPLNLDAIGLLAAGGTGYPIDLWQGSDVRELLVLISALPGGTSSPTANAIKRKLLLSSAPFPITPESGIEIEDLLFQRLAQLYRAGDLASLLSLFEQIPAEQVSIVQALASSQSSGSLMQAPPEQLSVVQASPSLQLIWKLKQVPLLHRSVVHALKSSQSLLAVQPSDSQMPFTHDSPAGQTIGSLTHPLAGLQLSTVQTFESLQLIARFQHVPLLQMSVVQAFESCVCCTRVRKKEGQGRRRAALPRIISESVLLLLPNAVQPRPAQPQDENTDEHQGQHREAQHAASRAAARVLARRDILFTAGRFGIGGPGGTGTRRQT
ncbi:MAG: hypothetical protein IH901_02670, partial [Proteobacteria bacterium]|nr:hypothetical protein [Pseudomonadota bacterium]